MVAVKMFQTVFLFLCAISVFWLTNASPTTTDDSVEIWEPTGPLEETLGPFQNCQSLCNPNEPGPKYQNLKIYANTTTRILVVANVTQLVSIAIDLKNGFYLLWSGVSGCVDVVDVQKKRGVLACPNDTALLRLDTIYNNPDLFHGHLNIITSLKDFFDPVLDPGGKQYELNNVPEKAMELGTYVLEFLIGRPSPSILQDPYAGVRLSLSLVQSIYDNLNGALKGILPLLKGKSVNGNLITFTEVLNALAVIVHNEFVE